MGKRIDRILFSFDKGLKKTGAVIAGLDLSLNHTGICIINDEGELLYKESIMVVHNVLKKETYHKIKYKVNDEVTEEPVDITGPDRKVHQVLRPSVIKKRILKILKEMKVTHVVIEGYSLSSKNKGMIFQIAELGGIIKNMLLENGYEFKIVPPTTLKKFLTGKGNALGKGEIQSAILKKYYLSFEDDNEADAFGLARIYFDMGEELGKYIMKDGAKYYDRQLKDFLAKK